MAALTAALMAANTIGGYFADRKRADAAVQQGNYAGDVSDRNATVAENQAADAIARGRQSEQLYRQGVKGTIGAQRASFAAQGIDVSSGSAQDVQADTASIGELDALTIRNNAARTSYGFQVQAANDRASGAQARTAGQNAAAGLRSQAASTLLTGAAQIYGQYKAGQDTLSPSKMRVPKATRVGVDSPYPTNQRVG